MILAVSPSALYLMGNFRRFRLFAAMVTNENERLGTKLKLGRELLKDFHVCCIFSNPLQTTYIMEANSKNPNQTASLETSLDLGSILFVILSTVVHQQLI